MTFIDWKQECQRSGKHSTTTGNVKVLHDFLMPQLERRRRIWVYLPPDYEDGASRYPVLYMQDGQNLFDAATSYVGEWQVDKTLDRLFYEKQVLSLIVVGIDNGEEKRFDEYIPEREGRAYASFLAHTLKPFIDSHFRTLAGRDYTGVMGSSLGGLISLYLGAHYPHVFSKIGALSSSTHFSDEIFPDWKKTMPMKLYLDVGTAEMGDPSGAEAFVAAVRENYHRLLEVGYDSEELKLVVDEGGRHHEEAWARRLPEALQWLYGGD